MPRKEHRLPLQRGGPRPAARVLGRPPAVAAPPAAGPGGGLAPGLGLRRPPGDAGGLRGRLARLGAQAPAARPERGGRGGGRAALTSGARERGSAPQRGRHSAR